MSLKNPLHRRHTYTRKTQTEFVHVTLIIQSFLHLTSFFFGLPHLPFYFCYCPPFSASKKKKKKKEKLTNPFSLLVAGHCCSIACERSYAWFDKQSDDDIAAHSHTEGFSG